jgi:RNA 3'-terminal phosphate cyclase (ATP)
VHIFNIRKGREKPGLRPQHLEGIRAAAQICSAETDGLTLNSLEAVFKPRDIHGGTFTIDTKTAGSITLILQTLVPIGIFAKASLTLTIRGGTAVPFSPTTEYFQHILCFFLERMGIHICIDTKRHGFYPRGGGEVVAKIEPSEIKSMNLIERGALQKIDVLSVASYHLKQSRVAERMIEGFKKIFPEINDTVHYGETVSPGCFIRSHAHFENSKLGADALGKRSKRAEDVGREAAQKLKVALDTGAPIDSWMVDQILPYMALATTYTKETSKIIIPQLTKHAETNIWVIKKFLNVTFEIKDGIMNCTGIGD